MSVICLTIKSKHFRRNIYGNNSRITNISRYKYIKLNYKLVFLLNFDLEITLRMRYNDYLDINILGVTIGTYCLLHIYYSSLSIYYKSRVNMYCFYQKRINYILPMCILLISCLW